MTTIPPAGLDERLWVIGRAMRLGKLDSWSLKFMKSVMGQAKRRRNWTPSAKQGAVINQLYDEVRQPDLVDVHGSLIDHQDTRAMRGG